MQRAIVITLLIAIAGCQSPAAPQSTTTLPPARGGVKPLIWEPPPVRATNISDRNATFTVISACNPVPYSPSSGTIDHGSTTYILFEPNGNPCSFDEVSIKASDGNTTGDDDCALIVTGDQINLENNVNAACQLNYLGGDNWGMVYALVSGAKTKGPRNH